ncbi:MAG: glycine betaine ABC transporter substrate-binding protein, partial [Chloroflexota bacterium]
MSVTVFRAQALRAILIASVWIVIGSVQVVQAQDETDPLMIGYPANDSLLMLIAEGYAQSAVDIGITAETQAIDGTFADAQAAIAEGRIDIYLSYTTRAVRAVTGAPPPAEPDAFEAALEAAIEQELQEERAWFNNSIDAGPVVYAAPEFAEANSIATLEDLATLSQTRSIRLGLLSRWEGDPDAWSQLAAVYQIDINRHTTQIVTNPYTALQELGEVHDVVVLSALDAALLGLQDIDPALPVLDAVPLADPLEATGDYRLLLAFDLAVESDFLVSTFSMMSPDSADLLGVYPALEANAAVLGFEEADLLITAGAVQSNHCR